MTDREPLRVGPLVLEWTTGRVTKEYPRPLPDAYVHHLAGSWQLVIRQREDGFWVWGTEQDGDSWRGSQHAYQEVVVAGALIYLTETGYLAQYRSRRRLLARECIDRADYLDALAFGFSGDLGVKRRRNAAKLRTLAEALRSP